MRAFFCFSAVLLGCIVTLLSLEAPAVAQIGNTPDLTRAIRASSLSGNFEAGFVKGVTGRSREVGNPTSLCGTNPASFQLRSTPLTRELRPEVRDDPTPVPTEPRFVVIDPPTGFAVKNQGQCGCCWVFGGVAAITGNRISQRRSASRDLSEQYIMDCLSVSLGKNPCEGGWFEDVAHFLKDFGTFSESEFPFQGAATGHPLKPNAPYRAVDFGYVNSNASSGVPSVGEIKKAIKKYGAVVAAIAAGEAFQNYRSGVFDRESSEDPINHAIALVGWDDSQGVWILRNSWGAQWGEGGYMKIKYNFRQVGYGAMYIVSAPPPPDIIKSPIDDRIRWWEINFPQYTKN